MRGRKRGGVWSVSEAGNAKSARTPARIGEAAAPARVEASVVEVEGGDPRQLLSECALVRESLRGVAKRASTTGLPPTETRVATGDSRYGQ